MKRTDIVALTPVDRYAAAASDPADAVRPGSWWRLAQPDHPFAARPRDADDLILLVDEARRVDGELHTVILRPHPMWADSYQHRAGLRMLAADFLSAFQPAPDGDAVRAAEAERAMDRVQRAMASMAAVPDDEPALLALADAKRAAQSSPEPAAPSADGASHAPSVLLPAALLPGRDLSAAMSRAERMVKLVEGRQAWIEARGAEMKTAMALVTGYQEERVALTLASVSDAQRHAKELMARVTSLRLFTGEDVSVRQLVDGASAPSDEPLYFYQRLLYLDEEIFVFGLDERFGVDLSAGFTAEHMDVLPKILATYPDLVNRMMPHPRSMVLARVRRDRRDHAPLPDDLSSALRRIFSDRAEDAADARVMILIRDGQRVHAVLADEETSNAQRLFPSKAEIDKLFSRPSWGREADIAITPDDLDYTDARSAHDARAQHYKRLLLIAWGLHARLELFGPFMDREANWLLATTHSSRFRFLADEENVLHDGRGSVEDWIAARNAGLVAGSRIVANWGPFANSRNAPSLRAYERDHERVLAEPVVPVSVQTVRQDGAQLVVAVEAVKTVWSQSAFSHVDKTFNARVVIHDAAARSSISLRQHCLCLDTVTSDELDAWISNRSARRSYRSWIQPFAVARALLRREEAELRVLYDAAADAAGVEWADFLAASRVWRDAKRWSMPRTSADAAAILAIARARAVARSNAPDSDEAFVEVDAKARIAVWRRADGAEHGLPTSAPWVVSGDRRAVAPVRPAARPGCVRESDGWDLWRQSLYAQCPPALHRPEDLSALSVLQAAERLESIRRLMNGDASAVQLLVHELFDIAHRISKRSVILPRLHIALAAGVSVPTSTPESDTRPRHGSFRVKSWVEAPRAFGLGLIASPLRVGLMLGQAQLVRKLACDLYRDPELAIQRASASDTSLFRLAWAPDLAANQLVEWARRPDALLSEDGLGLESVEPGFDSLEQALAAAFARRWRRDDPSELRIVVSEEARNVLERGL